MTPREFAFRPGRVEVDVPVGLTTGEGASIARARNLGRGGVFLATEGQHRVGDRLTVQLTLPDEGRALALDAEVRWIRHDGRRPTGVGLRFVNLPLESAIVIQEYLRKIDEDLTPSWPST